MNIGALVAVQTAARVASINAMNATRKRREEEEERKQREEELRKKRETRTGDKE